MNYLAHHINEGTTVSVKKENTNKYIFRADFFPISQYPGGVTYLEKEIGCYYSPDYSDQCLRVKIR